MQQHIGFGVIRPINTLNAQLKTFGLQLSRCISTWQVFLRIGLRFTHKHPALLNQPCTDTASAKTLGIQNILELHSNGQGKKILETQSKTPSYSNE